MDDRNRFFATSYISVKTKDEISDFLHVFDWKELFDSSKIYETGSFERNGTSFHYELYEFCISDEAKKKESWVVMAEEPSKELQEWCQCLRCTSCWYHLSYWTTCGCCIGCLKSGFPSQNQVKKARLHRLQTEGESIC